MRLDLGPGLTETRVPLSEEHSRLEGRLSSAASRIPVTDIIMPRLIALTPDYRAALGRACRDASAVIACHPYLVRELKAASSGQPLWFEAQDVELTLKRGVFESIPGAARLLDDVAALESEAWHSASFVFACTKGDLEELSTLYGPSAADTAVAPNGVSLDDFPFTPWSERRAKRLALGLPGQRLALFMGSWHPPNVDAAESLIALASARQDLICLVAGSVCHAMNGMDLPRNVRRLGVISDAERSQWLSVADVALNPMRYGSGSNLKMLDYLASGIPVITTPFGVRGLDLDDSLVSITELNGFADAIETLMAQSEAEQVRRVQAAREHVIQRFAWERIAADLAKDMTRHLSAA
jgi:glycosyltransferase involved in cell wall biosynthesis